MEKFAAMLADMPDTSRLKFTLQQLVAAALQDKGPVGLALREVALAGVNPGDTAFSKMPPETAASVLAGMNTLRGLLP